MASTLVALQTVTVGAGGAASVEFTNIPQTYNDLVVKASLRTNTGSVDAGTYFYINGAAIGVAKKLGGTGSVAFSDNGANIIDQGSGATANTFSNGEIYFPNYVNTGIKSMSVDWVNETNATTVYMNMLALTETVAPAAREPATSVKLAPYSGAQSFLQYSTVTLYGVYKSPLDTAVEAPTIGTATAASTGANVAFTPSGTGAPATSYVATSSPGNISATGTTSPILVTGLTSGTAYTFTVRGQNPGGLGAASAASNSVTPYDGYESIATVYGNNSSSLTFTSIPSTYTHLQIRLICRDTGAFTERALFMEYNGNSPSGSNSIHSIVGNGSTVTASSAINQGRYASINQIPAASATANVFSAQIIDILDYANTNKTKVTRILSGYDANGSGKIGIDSYLFNSTSAITSILLYSNNSFTSGTVIELYGIR